jgi:hypothetical protein
MWTRLDGEYRFAPTGDLFLGLRYFLDATMPPDTVEFRDATGRVVGRIIGIDFASDRGAE